MTLDLLNLLNILFAAILVLLVPGAALLAWLPRHQVPAETSSGEGFLSLAYGLLRSGADSLALSIALTALAGLLQFFAGTVLAGWVVAGLYGLCLAALIAALLLGRIRPVRSSVLAWLLAVGLVLIFAAFLVLWRLEQARDLALPAWVDPVHHTLLVRKILEYGGLPPDYQPYIPTPFFYHYGFHLMTALFVFWSSLPLPGAVLGMGQVLNAAVALAVFRAAGGQGIVSMEPGERAWSAARAVTAALLVNFVFQMPAYYLTWGRFTLLAGLCLLGPLIAAADEAVSGEGRAGARIRVAVLVAGLCLTHYFVLGLAGMYLLAAGLSRLAGFIRGTADRALLLKLATWAGSGILLSAPWLIRVWLYNRQDAAVLVNSPFDQSASAQKAAADLLNYLVYLVGPRRNHYVMAAAGMGLLWAFLRPAARVLAGWAVLLVVFALPWGIRFDPFRPDHFAIVLFFPAAILLAGLITSICRALSSHIDPLFGPLLWGLVVGSVVIWGARATHSITNPVTVFTTPADASALEWIANNTSQDARFYMNSTRWITNAYRGVDGAYWIAPATGRNSLIPPIFYVWAEPKYSQQINRWGERSAAVTGCGQEFWDIVREANLTHVYLREGQGSLQPAGLVNCPGLSQIYNSGGVHLYEISPP